MNNENKKIYVVMQGVMSETGNGDYWEDGRYTTLDEAKEEFECIKEDLGGVELKRRGYLHTVIEVHVWNEEEGDYEYEDAIEGFKCYRIK